MRNWIGAVAAPAIVAICNLHGDKVASKRVSIPLLQLARRKSIVFAFPPKALEPDL
jgi:hypothetical protein